MESTHACLILSSFLWRDNQKRTSTQTCKQWPVSRTVRMGDQHREGWAVSRFIFVSVFFFTLDLCALPLWPRILGFPERETDVVSWWGFSLVDTEVLAVADLLLKFSDLCAPVLFFLFLTLLWVYSQELQRCDSSLSREVNVCLVCLEREVC